MLPAPRRAAGERSVARGCVRWRRAPVPRLERIHAAADSACTAALPGRRRRHSSPAVRCAALCQRLRHRLCPHSRRHRTQRVRRVQSARCSGVERAGGNLRTQSTDASPGHAGRHNYRRPQRRLRNRMSSASRIATFARALLLGHVALIVFSSVAMVTVLNGPPGPWLAEEPNATVMRIAYRFSGPTYIVLGTLAAFWHAVDGLGVRRAALLLVAGGGVPLLAELIGTSTALPFGDYRYSGMLGYRIAGLVPFVIPLSWFYMLYACLAITGRLVSSVSPWLWALTASLLLVAWDVSMDLAMVKTAHWTWGDGRMFADAGLPGWLVLFFTRDVFYGMPLSNWFGWFVTGFVVARVMVAIAPPATLRDRVSPKTFPIVLYAVNGLFPVVL